MFRREANICKLAQEWKNFVNRNYTYQVTALDFCDESNEYAAIYVSKGRLYFSNDRIGSKGKSKYEWSGQFYSDLYKLDENSEIVALDESINTKNNEGSCTFNSDASTIYFTRCADLSVGDYFCQIYSKSLKNLKESDELLDLGGDLANSMNPTLHYTDTILIFASDRKEGLGQYDLYISKFRNGSWTIGENLGPQINSEGNEKFPVWNGDTLYFSSDYLPGMGGLDIFKHGRQ